MVRGKLLNSIDKPGLFTHTLWSVKPFMNPVNGHPATGTALGKTTCWLCFELAILTLTWYEEHRQYEELLVLKPSHKIPSRYEASA